MASAKTLVPRAVAILTTIQMGNEMMHKALDDNKFEEALDILNSMGITYEKMSELCEALAIEAMKNQKNLQLLMVMKGLSKITKT